MLTREQILAASSALNTQDVVSERLGGTVRLRELTAGEMMNFQRVTKDLDDSGRALELLALCWVDGTGARVFDGEESGIEAVPLQILNELMGAVVRVNGMGGEAEEAAGKPSRKRPTSSSSST